MSFRSKIVKRGTGHYILIPISALRKSDTKLGDTVIVEILKIPSKFLCSTCGNTFYSQDINPECNICGETNLKKISEEEQNEYG